MITTLLLIVLMVAVGALAAAFLRLSRRIESVLARTEAWLTSPQVRPPGLKPGDHVRSFSAQQHDGRPFSDRDLEGGVSVVLFMKADCVVCRALARDLSPRTLDRLGLGSRTYVVVRDRSERDALALDPGAQVVYQEDGTMSWAFRSSATPQAFVVGSDGVVAASGFPNSAQDLRRLVVQAAALGSPHAAVAG